MTITLSQDKRRALIKADNDEVVDVEELILSVGDVIEFKPSIHDDKIMSGVITTFWNMEKSIPGSIWMTIKETTGIINSDSVSLKNWKTLLDNGIIKN